MLTSLKVLENFAVGAVDGEIGSVVDVLFDDEHWVVRYLVVATGGLLSTRRVLLPTSSFRGVDWSTRHFNVALTVDQVKHSPDINTDAPVSRYQERQQAKYYGMPFYWNSAGVIGLGLFPGMASVAALDGAVDEALSDDHDIHLRSAKEVRGYHVLGVDDSVGRIEDFIANGDSWEVRYLVVETSAWWFGKHVLLSPSSASGISWEERTVRIEMSRKAIQHSPKWDGGFGIDGAYAARLDDYYQSFPAASADPQHPDENVTK